MNEEETDYLRLRSNLKKLCITGFANWNARTSSCVKGWRTAVRECSKARQPRERRSPLSSACNSDGEKLSKRFSKRNFSRQNATLSATLISPGRQISHRDGFEKNCNDFRRCSTLSTDSSVATLAVLRVGVVLGGFAAVEHAIVPNDPHATQPAAIRSSKLGFEAFGGGMVMPRGHQDKVAWHE
jgi:hypothetical protein